MNIQNSDAVITLSADGGWTLADEKAGEEANIFENEAAAEAAAEYLGWDVRIVPLHEWAARQASLHD